MTSKIPVTVLGAEASPPQAQPQSGKRAGAQRSALCDRWRAESVAQPHAIQGQENL
jgi:hypothetical protein